MHTLVSYNHWGFIVKYILERPPIVELLEFGITSQHRKDLGNPPVKRDLPDYDVLVHETHLTFQGPTGMET